MCVFLLKGVIGKLVLVLVDKVQWVALIISLMFMSRKILKTPERKRIYGRPRGQTPTMKQFPQLESVDLRQEKNLLFMEHV